MKGLVFDTTDKDSIEQLEGKHILVVASLWNREHVDKLIEKIRLRLEPKHSVTVLRVPGAWEIPFITRKHIHNPMFDAIITVGLLIKGETKHFEYIAKNVFNGLMQCQLIDEDALPVINGVLTVMNEEQVEERIELGTGWAESALHMIQLRI